MSDTKIRFKKFREINGSYFMPAIVWQILSTKRTQCPETELNVNLQKYGWKKFVKSHHANLSLSGFDHKKSRQITFWWRSDNNISLGIFNFSNITAVFFSIIQNPFSPLEINILEIRVDNNPIDRKKWIKTLMRGKNRTWPKITKNSSSAQYFIWLKCIRFQNSVCTIFFWHKKVAHCYFTRLNPKRTSLF